MLAARTVFFFSLALLAVAEPLLEAKLRQVSALDLADRSKWLSASVYGTVDSFLSEDILWWGSLSSTNIQISGAGLSHGVFKQDLTLVVGFGFDFQTGHAIAELYTYIPGSVSMQIYDFTNKTWSSQNIPVPVRAYQKLVPNSYVLDELSTLWLVSPDYVVQIDLVQFAVVAEIDLTKAFKSKYPVSRVTHVTSHSGHLFLVRSASADGRGPAQIVDLHTNATALMFNDVTYQDEVYNLFGWSNYVLWSQVSGSTGFVYGWDLNTKEVIQRGYIFLGGHQWGKAVTTNVNTNQSLLVSFSPSGSGYKAWTVSHEGKRSVFVALLAVPNDHLPEFALPSTMETRVLSVLLAGRNSTGYGKLTWLRYD